MKVSNDNGKVTIKCSERDARAIAVALAQCSEGNLKQSETVQMDALKRIALHLSSRQNTLADQIMQCVRFHEEG